ANNADNFRGRAAAGDQQCLADRIFVRKNFLCPCLADQTDVAPIGKIVFVEITSGDERNSPGLQIAGHNVVAWCARSLFDRQDIAVRARVKRAISTGEGNIAADSRALDARRVSQGRECLLNETLARRRIRILRDWQIDGANPKITRLEPEILLAQPNETGDE